MIVQYTIFAALVILNLVDIHSTYLFTEKGTKLEREGNPTQKWLFNKIGFWPGCIVGTVVFYSVLTYIMLHKVFGGFGLVVLSLATLYYLKIVIVNYYVYHKFVKKGCW